MLRACATLFLFLSIGGCALSHDRSSPVHPTPVHDAAVADASAPGDAGTCTLFWTSLSSCPASTAAAIGTHCTDEGATCGVNCCEPGPAIACEGGVWTATASHLLCAIDCAPPTPCGTGACAPGRVCVRLDGERGVGIASCVVPPAPIASCDDVAPAALTSPGTHPCESCRCAPGPVITLSCDCCDF